MAGGFDAHFPRASVTVVFTIKEVTMHPLSSATFSGQAVTRYRKSDKLGQLGARWLACQFNSKESDRTRSKLRVDIDESLIHNS